MTIQDKFTRGFMAGVIGGVVSTVSGMFSYSIGFTELRLFDWAAILIYARTPPFSLGDTLYAIVVHIGWSGMVGVLFAYIIRIIGSENYYFKGWLVGLAPWFTMYVLATLFKLEGTSNLSLFTVISNTIVSSIAGLTIAYSYVILYPSHSSVRGRSRSLMPQPAAKPEPQNYQDTVELTRDLEIDELRHQINDLENDIRQVERKVGKPRWKFW